MPVFFSSWNFRISGSSPVDLATAKQKTLRLFVSVRVEVETVEVAIVVKVEVAVILVEVTVVVVSDVVVVVVVVVDVGERGPIFLQLQPCSPGVQSTRQLACLASFS
mmetsp:Transcript_36658/g.117866  ORF Transcript_36658/g.117866 Transcript_36658/m.117866 type:complete len:107 (-) Transcript_36658:1848-2168(-)